MPFDAARSSLVTRAGAAALAVALAVALAAACDSSAPVPPPADPTPPPAANVADSTPASPPGGQPADPGAGPAARGVPDGEATTGVVGPEGGTLASADGRLLLDVPPGALSASVTIGIQPITAVVPDAVGTTYRLTPEDVRFARPVRLTLAYTEEDEEGRSPAGFGVAYQDAGGRRALAAGSTVDARARRVTVATDHFSDWMILEEYRLAPGDGAVRAGGRLELAVERCGFDAGGGDGPPTFAWACRPLADASGIRDWSVDGAVGGRAATGTVTQGGARSTFAAPAALPPNNPVTVSVEVPAPGTTRMLLVTTVQVVPDCPAPVCAFVGHSRVEDRVHEHMWSEGRARVTWVFSHGNALAAAYVPRGQVSAAFRHDHCPIRLAPSTHRLALVPYTPTAPSVLRVEFGRTPVTYSGSGTTEWAGTQTWTCPGDEPQVHDGIGVTWFSGDGVAHDAGLLLRGSRHTDGLRASWHFRGW